MNGIEKSARETVHTAAEAVESAAKAVQAARETVRTAQKAGSQAKIVAKKVVDRVSGREARRRKQQVAVAAGVVTAAVAAGVVASRVRKGRKH